MFLIFLMMVILYMASFDSPCDTSWRQYSGIFETVESWNSVPLLGSDVYYFYSAGGCGTFSLGMVFLLQWC